MQGLKSVQVVHVAKDLSASVLLLLGVSPKGHCLTQNAHVLGNYNFHCLLVLLKINTNTWLGRCGGRRGVQLHSASLPCVCGSGEQSRCLVGHGQGRQQSFTAWGPQCQELPKNCHCSSLGVIFSDETTNLPRGPCGPGTAFARRELEIRDGLPVPCLQLRQAVWKLRH